MTCVVALKDEETRRIYMAADSIGMCTDTYEKYIIKDPKIFYKNDKNGHRMLFGYSGSFRVGQVLKSELKIPTVLNTHPMDYLIKKLIPNMQDILESHKVSINEETPNSETLSLLITIKDRIFSIENNWSIIESTENYASVGIAGKFAMGYLYATEDTDIPASARIYNSVEAATKFSAASSMPCHVIDNPY